MLKRVVFNLYDLGLSLHCEGLYLQILFEVLYYLPEICFINLIYTFKVFVIKFLIFILFNKYIIK